MNKKFSTLVAGLLLAGAVGTVNAAVEKGAISEAPRITAKAIDGKFYQLSDGYRVLAMEQTTDGSFKLVFADYDQVELAKSLWEVRATDSKDEKGLSFQFFNVASGLPISIDASKATKVGEPMVVAPMAEGEMTWSWVRGVEGDPLLDATALEAFVGAKRDTVVTLVNTSDGIAAVRYATKDMASYKGQALKVKPMEASPIYLNAYDLNTMMQTGKSNLQLAFNPNVSSTAKVNEFTGKDGKRVFNVVNPLSNNTLSIGAVADAEKEVAQKQAAYNTVNTDLSAAIEELVSLDGSFGTIKVDFDDAKQLHQDAIDAKIQAQEDLSSAIANVTKYTKRRDKQIKLLESQLQLVGVDAKAYNDALAAKNTADAALKTATLTYNNASAEWEVLTTAADEAANAYTLASAKARVANNIVKYITNIFNDAMTTNKTKTGLQYVSQILPTSADFAGLQKNDAVAAEKLTAYFNGITAKLSAQLTQAAVTAYLAPYNDAKTNAAAELKTARTNRNSTKSAKDAYQTTYDAAVNAFTTASTEADKANTAYLDLSLKYAASSSDAADIKAKIEKYQNLIDENNKAKYEAIALIADLDEKIPVLWDNVMDLADQFSEIGTDFGMAQIKVEELKVEHQAAWSALNDAKRRLIVLQNQETADNWYSLQIPKTDTYLMVDTSYIEGYSSVKHQTFAINKFKAAEQKYVDKNGTVLIDKMTARDINGRFNFRFLYYPTQDSLVITSDGGNAKPVQNEYWWHARPIVNIAQNGTNYVKLAVLGAGENEHREVTLGAPYEIYNGTQWAQQTLNTRIGMGLIKNTPATAIPAGLYFIDVVASENSQKNGARLMSDLSWNITKVTPAEWSVMDFDHMPSAKWVVEENNVYGTYSVIKNLESTRRLNARYTVESVKDGVVTVTFDYYNYQGGRFEETVKMTPTQYNDYGWYHEDTANKYFTLNYLNAGGNMGLTIGNSTVGNDTILRVSKDEATKFDLIKAWNWRYGVNDTIKAATYLIRVNDAYKFANNQKYVQISEVDGTEMMVVTADQSKATPFELKEVNCVDGTHYYAIMWAGRKAGVIDATGLIKAERIEMETRTSAFSLTPVNVDIYRRLNNAELGENENDAPNVMKFYRVNSTDKEYLYEDALSKYSAGKGVNFLGVEGKGDSKKAAMYVDTAYVDRNTLMPQYLIALAPSIVEGDTTLCDVCGELNCEHSKVTRTYTDGRYLVNLIDSVKKYDGKADEAKYTWNEIYKRLAFVPARHMGDSLIIHRAKPTAADTINLAKNTHNPVAFSFRLVSDNSNDFLIESESWGKKTEFDGGISPVNYGGWIKIQNGVPVILNAPWSEAVMQAEVFNAEVTDENPTANEAVEAAEVSVVAAQGAIIVKGAAGKVVTVANILGQTIANQVAASDNVTIAAPAGIAVVTVDGEATKVVVK
ncbi:MAG: DUF6383 domain-containing protein [bacterium]|nr:DUF6383 domain-containing protein [bacterium]